MLTVGTPRYRLLIFDWDGTLADSAAPIIESIQRTLLQIGKVPPSAMAIRKIIGLNLIEGLAALYPTEDAHHLAQQCQAVTLEGSGADPAGAHGELFDGAHTVLSEFKHAGVWLAVATGKSRAGLNDAMQCHGLTGYFLTTRTADDARSKPHPDMLLSILDELGVMPAEALMIGDTTYDLNMANAAGMDCVGVTYGVHSVDTLRATGHAQVFIDALTSLPDIVRSESQV